MKGHDEWEEVLVVQVPEMMEMLMLRFFSMTGAVTMVVMTNEAEEVEMIEFPLMLRLILILVLILILILILILFLLISFSSSFYDWDGLPAMLQHQPSIFSWPALS
jgi:glucan phosphoethanolaminetransferase (alkaline phosphatase superfamily)